MKPWTITTIPPERWRLSPAETDVMDSLVELGQASAVAAALGISINAVHTRSWRARQSMGAANITQAAVAWDRYSRERA